MPPSVAPDNQQNEITLDAVLARLAPLKGGDARKKEIASLLQKSDQGVFLDLFDESYDRFTRIEKEIAERTSPEASTDLDEKRDLLSEARSLIGTLCNERFTNDNEEDRRKWVKSITHY